MSEPSLHVQHPAGPARAVVLLLHGGREHDTTPVRPGNLAALRLIPFGRSLHATGAGLTVARLRYRVRGWNGQRCSPVADARWALERLAGRFPGAPLALVGHSMGARTALYVAGHDAVRAVVALAPWIVAGDPVAPLAGRRVLVAHGDRDRVTSAQTSEAYARAVAGIAASTGYVSVHGDGHAMTYRPLIWHRLVTAYLLGALDAVPARPVRGDRLAAVARQALAGSAPCVL